MYDCVLTEIKPWHRNCVKSRSELCKVRTWFWYTRVSVNTIQNKVRTTLITTPIERQWHIYKNCSTSDYPDKTSSWLTWFIDYLGEISWLTCPLEPAIVYRRNTMGLQARTSISRLWFCYLMIMWSWVSHFSFTTFNFFFHKAEMIDTSRVAWNK